MKNLPFFLILTGIFFSCSKDNNNQNIVDPNLIGKWKLIQTFEDPGDGSGVYESIDSEKTIAFFNNGTFSISGPLCGLSTLIGENITGNVHTSDYSEDKVLTSNETCELNNPSAEYKVAIENSFLIIYWTACIEGCAQKYQQLTDE